MKIWIALVALFVAPLSQAQSPHADFPNWTVAERCTPIPGKWFPGDVARCNQAEQLAHDQLINQWGAIDGRSINVCVGQELTIHAGPPSFVELKRCISIQPWSQQPIVANRPTDRHPFPDFSIESRCKTMLPDPSDQTKRDQCDAGERSASGWLSSNWLSMPAKSINWCMNEGMAEEVGPPSYSNLKNCVQYRSNIDQSRAEPAPIHKSLLQSLLGH